MDAELGEAVRLASAPALGHGRRWLRCSSCHRWAIGRAGDRCKQTAAQGKARKRPDGTVAMSWSCPGTLAPATGPAGAEGGCQRPGCQNAPDLVTARGELVCRRCCWELALGGLQ